MDWLGHGLLPFLRELFDHARARECREAHAPKGRLLLGRVTQGIGDVQGHGDLVAVYQEATDRGLVGDTLDELLVAVRHLRPYRFNAVQMRFYHYSAAVRRDTGDIGIADVHVLSGGGRQEKLPLRI